jgi:hypothetical protein
MTAATPNSLNVVGEHLAGWNPVTPAAYVTAKTLSASTVATITVPAGVQFVRLAGTADFFYSFSQTAALPTTNDNGTDCELIKSSAPAEWRLIPSGATSISLIARGTPDVSASFYAP